VIQHIHTVFVETSCLDSFERTNANSTCHASDAFMHHTQSLCVITAIQVISDPQEKDAALEALVEHIIPGRSADGVRPNNKSELTSTVIVSLSLDEASAKVRTGPPKDDIEDYELDVWAGEIPLQQTVGKPLDDPKLKSGVSVPEYVAEYTRHNTA